MFTRQIGFAPLSAETVWFRLLRDIGHCQVFGYGNWAVTGRETGLYMGSVGVFNYRRDLDPIFDSPEVGWGLDPAFHGGGFATEALSVALEHADSVLEIPRTVCMISPDNAPSLKLALKVGFTPWRQGDYHGETLTMMERRR